MVDLLQSAYGLNYMKYVKKKIDLKLISNNHKPIKRLSAVT